VALAVELMCGAVTRREVGRPESTAALAGARKQLLGVTEEVTEALRRTANASSQWTPCNTWMDVVSQWSSAMAIARRRIADAAASSSLPIVQAWYFAKVR